jgi:hypothetical protein
LVYKACKLRKPQIIYLKNKKTDSPHLMQTVGQCGIRIPDATWQRVVVFFRKERKTAYALINVL